MSERISITYTIDMKELEQEITRLYESMILSISNLSNSCYLPDNLLSESTLRELLSISESLKNVIFKASDIENIVKSYLNYITQPMETKDPNQLEQLQNLAKTLNSMKNENTDL